MGDLYNRGKLVLATTCPWVTGSDIRVLLTTSSYTPSEDHATVSQVTNELSGGNYVRKALSSLAASQNDTDNRAELDAADVTWTALSASSFPTYAVVFDNSGGSDAARSLIGWVELTPSSGTGIPNGADWQAVWDATGLFRLT